MIESVRRQLFRRAPTKQSYELQLAGSEKKLEGVLTLDFEAMEG
jgi:hypothetical protein